MCSLHELMCACGGMGLQAGGWGPVSQELLPHAAVEAKLLLFGVERVELILESRISIPKPPWGELTWLVHNECDGARCLFVCRVACV